MKNATNQISRIFFIDNLRIFLIALVVLHHLSITYGAIGGWYYKEVEGDLFTTVILTMFTASNQSFFMGFFFLISAYFTRISLERKTVGTFVKDRLVRLGIPLIVFFFVLSPLTNFIKVKFGDGVDIDLFEFVKQYHGIGFGPLWFVEALIYFSLIYAGYRWLSGRKAGAPSEPRKFPKPTIIALYALGISALSFVVRLWFPLGSELGYTGFQLPYFPQYIALFFAGLLFAKYNWFDAITFRQGVKWFAVAQVFIIVVFPIFFMFGGDDSEAFRGGWTWQSAVLCIWEQVTGFSLMIGLTGIFNEKLNKQGKLAQLLSGSAYAVFIIHAFVVVALSLIVKDWVVYPVLKFIVLTPFALFFCFGIGMFLKQIPGVNKVI